MSDFPRGWTFSGFAGSGVIASLGVPAAPGVTHVLDSVSWRFFSPGAGGPYSVTLASSDGAFSGFNLGVAVIAAAGGIDEGSQSGLDLAAGPGASFTVAFSGSAAGMSEWLLIQGHDI